MSEYLENLDEIVRIAGFDFELFKNPLLNWEIIYEQRKVGKSFDTKRKAKNYLEKFYYPEKLKHVKFL